MICSHCRAENPNSNWYCNSCGSSLRESRPVSPGRAGKAEPSVVTEASKKSARRGKKSAGAAELFAGRYAGLERIGEGAMATVYKALDSVLDQVVALKVLHPGLAVNRDYLGRFHREIALARTITHPNVYRIYDIGSHGETQFISMEYVRGHELKAQLERGPMEPESGLKIIRQIAAALDQAHGLGIVHRDLKPQNIMIEDPGWRVVVMDFGIATARDVSSLTVSGTFLGTPEYISPEQAQGLAPDQRTDIYSLGVIMYEMFTGSLPFGPGKPVAVAISHIQDSPPDPCRINPSLPVEIERIILKAMAKDPSRRYQSVSELRLDLDGLVGDNGTDAKAPVADSRTRSAPAVLAGITSNPYLNRKMIRDSRYFYGRRREANTIFGRIGASRPQSVSIVGERRIGKSSLLHYINDPENRRACLKDYQKYTFIFMDFQEKRGVPLEGFFSGLFEALAVELGDEISPLPEPGYNGFKKICEELDRRDRKLVLLFDEFESITKNKNFDPEFFAFLRSVANNYNVAYITSSVKNLQELCYDREISDSPFFNIFSNLNLSAFNEEEAREFVAEPSRLNSHPLEEHFETVVDLAGYFPFYMSIACSILFEFDFRDADPKRTVFENIEDQFLDEAGMHFQFILHSLRDDEKETCRRIMSGENLGELDRYTARNLLKRGYLIESGSPPELRLFSLTFGRMLNEELLRKK